MTIQLDRLEKETLQNISEAEDKLLAQRALIILLSEDGLSSTLIAQEVGVTSRTVKRWQKKFSEDGLNIFPQHVILVESLSITDEAGDQAVSRLEEPAVAAGEQPEEPPPTVSPAEDTPAKASKGKQKRGGNKNQAEQFDFPIRKKVGLQETDPFAEAGRKVLAFHFARMLKHEAGTRLGEDIEELHDMRVATRRMRAAFRVFSAAFSKKKTKSILMGLRATGRALGPVRDLDVFIQKLEQYQETLPTNEQENLQVFLDIWQKKRKAARKVMLKYLDSSGYDRFKQEFLEFVTTEGMAAKPVPERVPPVPDQLRHVAPVLIYEAYAQVRAFETILDNAAIDTLHQLRISFKGLRYTLEFLEEILGDGRELIIRRVKQMQNHLGDLNDADVAGKILSEFLMEWEAHQLHLPLRDRQSPLQMVAYLQVQLEKRHELLVSFPQAWEQFTQPDLRENLAKAVSIL